MAELTEDELALWAEGDEWEEWFPVLLPFMVNLRTAKPDIKALARMLRKDKPLPPQIRYWLADLLDPQKLRQPEYNWQLRPVYTGRRVAGLREAEKKRLLGEAVAVAPTVTDAIVEIDASGAMSGRTAWTVWKELKAERASLEEYAPEIEALVKYLLDNIKPMPFQGKSVDTTEEAKQILDRLIPRRRP